MFSIGQKVRIKENSGYDTYLYSGMIGVIALIESNNRAATIKLLNKKDRDYILSKRWRVEPYIDFSFLEKTNIGGGLIKNE